MGVLNTAGGITNPGDIISALSLGLFFVFVTGILNEVFPNKIHD